MFTLSICMIIKNEEKTLARCLDSIKGIADELIIVDTGSSDSSIEITKKYTDNVYYFEWCNDFSKARNYSFSKASCEYIMWLDADDVVYKQDFDKLIDWKKGGIPADVYMLKYNIAFDKDDNPTFFYYRERIVKNTKLFIWEGFVHEVITPCGKIEYCDIAITHKKEKIADKKRNLKLYDYHIKKGVALNTRELYYYARELFYNNYFSKASIYFRKFLRSQNQYLPNTRVAVFSLSECYKKKNKIKEAKRVVLNHFLTNSPTAQLCCQLGELFEISNDLELSIFWYKCAINCEIPKNTGDFIEENYYSLIPLVSLTNLYYRIGDEKKSRHFHNIAMSKHPSDPSVIFNENFFQCLK